MYLDTIAMAEKLRGPYREAFEKADMYCMKGNSEMNDKKMDLFDMLMEAQEEGKPVEKIVGDDIESFCKTFFDEKRRYLDDINVFQWLYRIAWIGFIFVIWDFWDFYQAKPPGTSLWIMETEVSFLFVGVMAGVVGSLIFVACLKYGLEPLIFKKTKLKPVIYNTIVLLLGIVTFGLPIYYACQIDTEYYINGTWMLTALAGYIIIYLIVRSILRYRKHGTIRKHDKAQRKAEKKVLDAFNRSISAEADRKDTAAIMAKQFQKIQKGKDEFTHEMYAEKVRKTEGFLSNPVSLWISDILLTLAIGAYPFFRIAKTDGIWEAIIFGGIFLIVEIVVFRFINKIINEVSEEKLDILNRCEELGVDIVTYAENILEETDEHGVS